MIRPKRSTYALRSGANISYLEAGERHTGRPSVVLIHGFPSSAATFRDVIPTLAETDYVIAPDMPGYGQSDTLPETTFESYAAALTELLDHLEIKERIIYLHDFGAPVGLRIAMDAPKLVSGLIIQNANAHRSGHRPDWKDTIEYWTHPNRDNEAAATAHLTLEGTRDQYIYGVPEDVASKIKPEVWQEDWRVMNLPGRMNAQKALIADYGNYVQQFDTISKYLRTHQPPALMLWGRHDSFFALDETVSWMEDLPRMETHILDGAHFLLETHAEPASKLMKAFIEKR